MEQRIKGDIVPPKVVDSCRIIVFPSFKLLFLFFMVVVARPSLEHRQRADGLASAQAPYAPRTGGSLLFAGQLACFTQAAS